MGNPSAAELFKLADNAAPKDDRLLPTERKYLKTSKTLSLSEALANLKERKKNPHKRIAGGLDDESAAVRLFTPEKALEKAPEKEPETAPETTPETSPQEEPLTSALQNLQTLQSSEDLKKGRARFPVQTVTAIVSGLAVLIKEIIVLKDRIGKKKQETPEKEKENPLQAFRQEKHKVTFHLNGMAFTVTSLGLIRDEQAHTLVIPFEQNAEAFFTPPLQSELHLDYDGAPVDGKLFYFGMSFVLEALGLRFLGFLYDETDSSAISLERE